MKNMSEFQRYKDNYLAFVKINQVFGYNSLPKKVETLRVDARRVLGSLQGELKCGHDENSIQFALEDETRWTPEVVDLVCNFDILIQKISEVIEEVREESMEALDASLGGDSEIAERREAHVEAGNISLDPFGDRYQDIENGLRPTEGDQLGFDIMEEEPSNVHAVTQRVSSAAENFARANGDMAQDDSSAPIVELDVFEGEEDDDEAEDGVEVRIIESEEWED